MLQSMRSAAKWIWLIIAIVFVGGFVFYESSGLFGRTAVTSTTAVATVNGQDILYTTWANARENAVREQEQRAGHSLTGEERDRVGEEVFNQLVTDILLQQEYAKRGITVSDDEIREAAQYAPPPQLMQAEELQTDGQFDPEKYQRFLRSPVAKQGGLLYQLEGYYRAEIPKQKLFQQVATDAYISDARLWQMWKDARDSAQISYVALRPTALASLHATLALAYENQENTLRALEQRTEADRYLDTPEAVRENQKMILQSLAAQPRETLLGLRGESADTAVQGWIDLALALIAPQRGTALAQWRQAYPDHRADVSQLGTQVPTAASQATPSALTGKVALLLPLEVPTFAFAAEAVRSGFMAAHRTAGSTTEIAIYPTHGQQEEIAALYRQALAEGAQ